MKSRTLLLTLILTGLIAMIFSCSKESNDNNTIKITSITPSSPADMPFGEFVLIWYEYQIDYSEGARMWIQPFTNGDITPDFLYSSSKVYSGAGSRQVGISVKDGDGPVKVDQLRIVMVSPDKELTLYETFTDVNSNFK